MRANAVRPSLDHFPFGGREQRSFCVREFWIDDAENVLVGQRRGMAVIDKIAGFRNTEIARGNFEFLRREEFRKFLTRPAIEFAFVSFAVGVLSGIETTFGMGHIAQDIIENVADDRRELLVA